jgi:hypothetical protein
MGLFHPPSDPTEWNYLLPLIAGFGVSLAYLPSQIRLYAEQIEITDEAIEVVRSNGRRDVIPWGSVQSARSSELRSALVVRSPETTIRIPHVIVGYGRDAPRQILHVGHAKGMRATRIFAFARLIRWAVAVSCARKARAISGTVRPLTMRSVSATRLSCESAG